MAEFVTRETLHRVADVTIVPAPSVHRGVREAIDRSFELPTGLYVATAGLYLGFIALMAASFLNPGLIIPLTICGLFIVAAFGVPTLWARMSPENRQRALSFGAFRNRGVATGSGHLDAGSAAVQVLILPVLIFAWGLAVTVIVALH